jgi:hypothetical protein
VEDSGCSAETGEDNVDEKVVVATCSLEDGQWRYEEGDDCETESTLSKVSGW